jgi:hypothetical protein
MSRCNHLLVQGNFELGYGIAANSNKKEYPTYLYITLSYSTMKTHIYTGLFKVVGIDPDTQKHPNYLPGLTGQFEFVVDLAPNLAKEDQPISVLVQTQQGNQIGEASGHADGRSKVRRSREDPVLIYDGRITHKLLPSTEVMVKSVLKDCCIDSARVSSTVRTPEEQAEVMYENIINHPNAKDILSGISRQKLLYKRSPAAQKIIEAYEDMLTNPVLDEKGIPTKDKNGIPLLALIFTDAELRQKKQEFVQIIIDRMRLPKTDPDYATKFIDPFEVSKHIKNEQETASHLYDVFDIGPRSIGSDHGRKCFQNALSKLKEQGSLVKFIPPPLDPGFHIETVPITPNPEH